MATREVSPEPPSDTATVAGAESGQISQNIAAVHDFYTREELKRSVSQRHAESISRAMGRPVFLVAILVFVAIWVGVNLVSITVGKAPFDDAPFFWLQGLIGLASLLTTTVVLIKQNRVSKLSEQREHLDLKVALLIEQKTAKLIDLVEELRRDLPNVQNRHDSGAVAMQQPMSPEGVLAALDEEVTGPDGSISVSTADSR